MKRIIALLSAFLVTLSLCGNTTVAEAKEKISTKQSLEEMEVHFIDVGQGDATLIKCGDSAMLIDAGENDKGTAIQNYLRKQGVKSLDYLIVTHPDADHCGGADVIITKYDIDTIIMPNYAKDTATYRDVVKAMDYKRYKATDPVVGDTYKLGDAEFTIIAPNSEDYGDEANNYSVGILLRHGNKKFVFTGDAEEEAETDIVNNKLDISADVLQVGHHGSKTASTKKFIDAVKPTYAVISCGEGNSYGHPHAATLNTLRAAGVKLFRTDEQGSIVATSDGKKITWNTAPSDTWLTGEPTKSANTPKATTEPKKEVKQQEATTAPKETEPVTQQDDKSEIVHITKTGKKYHNAGCASLSKSDIEVTLGEALSKGLEPCSKCH